jgi:hypothetical protein
MMCGLVGIRDFTDAPIKQHELTPMLDVVTLVYPLGVLPVGGDHLFDRDGVRVAGGKDPAAGLPL